MNADTVIREEIERNVYRMREEESGVCVDVGAHHGHFALDALRRGFRRVYCYEADFRNYGVCRARVPYCVTWGAVWRAGYGGARIPMRWQWKEDGDNTGAGSVAYGDGLFDMVPTHELPAIDIDFLKLDCEGAEYPILYTADLSRVRRIAMEIHFAIDFHKSAIVDGFNNTVEAMADFLMVQGFNVDIAGHGVRTSYLYASRR